MAPLKISLTSFLLISALLLTLPVSPEEPLTNAAANSQEPPSRALLRERFTMLRNNGVTCVEPPQESDEYLTVLESLGYHDLLAECLEERINQNYRGAAENPETWRRLGEAWMLSGPPGCQKALDAFQQALKLRQEDTRTRELLAELLYREGLYKQARAAYETVLELDPENVPARLGKAGLLVREGNITEAAALINAVGAAAQPYDVTTRLMMRSALKDFEHQRGWFSDTPENHNAYARLLYQAGRITDALIAARRAVELAPDAHAIWNFIAAMHIQLGTLEQAVQAYDKSLKANPHQPQIEAARSRLVSQLKSQSPK